MSPFRILVIFFALGLVGLALLPQLSVDLNPAARENAFTLTFNAPNLSPGLLEQRVTAPLENALSQLGDLKKIKSESSYGQGVITLVFDDRADMDYKRFELATILRQALPQLPEQIGYPDVVQRSDGKSRSPLLVYSVYAPFTPFQIRQVAQDVVANRLAQLQGIKAARLLGANGLRVVVSLDLQRLTAHGMLPAEVLAALREKEKGRFLGLVGTEPGQRAFLQLPGGLGDLDQLRQLTLGKSGRLQLSDVAQVYVEEEPPTSHYRINGENAIRMVLDAEEGVNKLELAHQVKRILPDLVQQLPAGYDFRLDYDDTAYVGKELLKIYYRSGLSVGILLLFILLSQRSWRYLAVLLIGIALNLSFTALLVYLAGISIHLYSLAGLTVSFGIILDNAIVMTDHLHKRQDRRVFMALLAASLTTVAALLLVFALPKEDQANLTDFALIISANITCSLLVALWPVPALYQLLLSPAGGKKENALAPPGKAFGYYARAIAWVAHYRKAFYLLTLLGFGLPVFLLPTKVEGWEWYNQTLGHPAYVEHVRPWVNRALGGALRPFVENVFERYGYRSSEQTKLFVTAGMGPGNTLEQMDYLMRKVEEYLKTVQGLDKFVTNVYSGQVARIQISFQPEAENGFLPYQLKSRLIARSVDWGAVNWNISGVGRFFSNNAGNPTPSFKVEMRGYQFADLQAQAEGFAARLLAHPRIQEVNTNELLGYGEKKDLEMVFSYQTEELAQTGLSPGQVSAQLQAKADARSPQLRASFKAGSSGAQAGGEGLAGKSLPVYLADQEAKNFDRYRLLNEPLQADTSQLSIRPGTFGQLTLETLSNTIHKEDRQYIRMVSFEYQGSYHFGNKYLQEMLALHKAALPPGYSMEERSFRFGFNQVKRQYSLLLVLLVAIFFICAILFESLWQPLVIMATIPLSFIGLFLTFWLFDFYFDQGGYAAFIMLGGLVVNAGILIINDYNQPGTLQANQRLLLALRQKAMPIFLTTASSVLGLVPFLLEGDKEVFWFSFAAGTMGGLVFSMLAVFVFLPVACWRKQPGSQG